MKNQTGFTLVEILIVFSIFLIISSASTILLRPQYLLFEKERFISQFKADFFYSQQYAISQQKLLTIYIDPKKSRYFIKEKLSSRVIVDRKIPELITLKEGSLGTFPVNIEFQPNGGINRFGTIDFIVGKQRYKMTFQIGVGRFYVVKET